MLDKKGYIGSVTKEVGGDMIIAVFILLCAGIVLVVLIGLFCGLPIFVMMGG